jgi:hypothetical protein
MLLRLHAAGRVGFQRQEYEELVAVIQRDGQPRLSLDLQCKPVVVLLRSTLPLDESIHVPNFRKADTTLVGIEVRPTKISLAGGVPGTGYVCLAYVQCIADFWFPPPGIETELLIHGEEPALIGRDILGSWIAEFNGPRQILSIYE